MSKTNITDNAANNSKKSDNLEILASLQNAAFIHPKKIGHTLQGSVWSATSDDEQKFVIKATSKHLHQHSITRYNGKAQRVHENINKETKILKAISRDKNAPKSIVKYIDSFQTDNYYFLVMEHGGTDLFDFVLKAHHLIAIGKLDISEWQKCVKVIFNQLIQTVRYLHSMNISHFDISLENLVINDVDIEIIPNSKKFRFLTDTIQIKLIDFGLAECDMSDWKSNKFVGKEIYKSPEVHSKIGPFDAKSNDIFCCGVCLFMLLIGSPPWHRASIEDAAFQHIANGHIIRLLSHWGRLQFVTAQSLDLLTHIIGQYEKQRITLDGILNHSWLAQTDLSKQK